MPAKNSGCLETMLPIALLILILASLLAAGLFLGIPYLQGRSEYPQGTFPLVVEGNAIMVRMNPEKEVALVPNAALDLGTGGQIVGAIATGTPAILPTAPPVIPTEPPPPPTLPPVTPTSRPQLGCVAFTGYTVQSGDTLYSISRKFVTSISLMARHGISSTSLVPGAALRIPVGDPGCCSGGWRPYVVEDGETWFSIAQACGITTDALYQGNGVGAGAPLYLTQVICVP